MQSLSLPLPKVTWKRRKPPRHLKKIYLLSLSSLLSPLLSLVLFLRVCQPVSILENSCPISFVDGLSIPMFSVYRSTGGFAVRRSEKMRSVLPVSSIDTSVVDAEEPFQEEEEARKMAESTRPAKLGT